MAVRVNIGQDNYAAWRFVVVDELGNSLWAGPQYPTPELARADAELVCREHHEWGPAVYFVDGATHANAASRLPAPHVDVVEEARRAGVAPTGSAPGEVPPPPRVLPPDVGMSERGGDELGNPITAQRQRVSATVEE